MIPVQCFEGMCVLGSQGRSPTEMAQARQPKTGGWGGGLGERWGGGGAWGRTGPDLRSGPAGGHGTPDDPMHKRSPIDWASGPTDPCSHPLSVRVSGFFFVADEATVVAKLVRFFFAIVHVP